MNHHTDLQPILSTMWCGRPSRLQEPKMMALCGALAVALELQLFI